MHRMPLKTGFHLNECNDSAEAARCGAWVVCSNVGANALSDLSLITRDIYINYIPIDSS